MRSLDNQNMFDLTFQEFGTYEAVFNFANANNISITDNLLPGSNLIIPDSIKDASILTYIKSINLKPSTGFSVDNQIVVNGLNERNSNVINTGGGIKYPITSTNIVINIEEGSYRIKSTNNPWIILYESKMYSQYWIVDLDLFGWDEAVVVDVFDLEGKSFVQNIPKSSYSMNDRKVKISFPFAAAKGKAYIMKIK